MKAKIFFLGVVCLLVTSSGIILSQNYVPQRSRLVISGEVIRLGDIPNENSEWRFRLVQYRVLNVCEGDYDKKEIIVSHFPEEVENLDIGAKVCAVVSKTIGPNTTKDWSIDFTGKDFHYTTDGLLLKKCTCQK